MLLFPRLCAIFDQSYRINALHTTFTAVTCSVEAVHSYSQSVRLIHTSPCTIRIYISSGRLEAGVAKVCWIILLFDKAQAQSLDPDWK